MCQEKISEDKFLASIQKGTKRNNCVLAGDSLECGIGALILFI